MIDGLRSYPAYRKRRVPGLDVLPEAWLATTLRRRLRPYDGIKIGPFGSQLKLEGMAATGYKVYGQANVIAADFERGNKHIDVSKFRELQSCEVRPGDLLITMMGTSGRCARVPEGAPAGIMDSHLLRLRPDADIDPDFLALVLDRAVYLKDQIRVAGKGSIMEGLNSSMVKDLVLALPSMPEQAAIVRFLGHADRRIRRCTAAKKKLIALLDEQKQAIIHHAVTRGLDPSAHLKASGLEWLGDIPAHWEVRRNGQLFAQRNQKGFGELPILEVSLKTGVRVREFADTDRKQVMSDREQYKRAEKGDIAYNMMRMWQGAVGIALVDGLVSPAYVVARPRKSVVARYFTNLFRTAAYMGEVDNASRGIVKDRNRLYWEDFKQLHSPYPPPDEQERIVAAIDTNAGAVTAGIERVEREIALLREYRTRLIADVVTGKLDVREAAIRLPDEVDEPELPGDADALAEGDESGDEADLGTAAGEAEA